MLPPATSLPIVVTILLCSSALPLVAQDQPTRTSYCRMLDIDALIDSQARFLARRYNLSEEQAEFTRAFLHEQTNRFLEKHREELFDLVDRLVEVRAGAEMDLQELISWGQRALPIYQEAKALIVEGNKQWREILTEEQRRIHDEDLREMQESFETTEDQLARIVAGQMTVEEFRKGPARQAPRARAEAGANPQPPTTPRPSPPVPPSNPPTPPSAQQSATPPRPVTVPPAVRRYDRDLRAHQHQSGPEGRAGRPESQPRSSTVIVGRTSPVGGSADFESQWEAYVREFVQKYQLNEAQKARAEAILKDCQQRAHRVMQTRKAELERLDKELAAVSESKDTDRAKELARINDRRTKLLEPIGEIFEKQLKPRLEKLPTRAQRQAAEKSGTRSSSTTAERTVRPPPAPPVRPVPPPPATPPPVAEPDVPPGEGETPPPEEPEQDDRSTS